MEARCTKEGNHDRAIRCFARCPCTAMAPPSGGPPWSWRLSVGRWTAAAVASLVVVQGPGLVTHVVLTAVAVATTDLNAKAEADKAAAVTAAIAAAVEDAKRAAEAGKAFAVAAVKSEAVAAVTAELTTKAEADKASAIDTTTRSLTAELQMCALGSSGFFLHALCLHCSKLHSCCAQHCSGMDVGSNPSLHRHSTPAAIEAHKHARSGQTKTQYQSRQRGVHACATMCSLCPAPIPPLKVTVSGGTTGPASGA